MVYINVTIEIYPASNSNSTGEQMKIRMRIADLVTLLTMTSRSRAKKVISRYNIGIEKIKVIEKALQQGKWRLV